MLSGPNDESPANIDAAVSVIIMSQIRLTFCRTCRFSVRPHAIDSMRILSFRSSVAERVEGEP